MLRGKYALFFDHARGQSIQPMYSAQRQQSMTVEARDIIHHAQIAKQAMNKGQMPQAADKHVTQTPHDGSKPMPSNSIASRQLKQS